MFFIIDKHTFQWIYTNIFGYQDLEIVKKNNI